MQYLTFPVELQHTQQTHGLEHLSDVHLQAALQLDEEPADFRVDLSILWPTSPAKRYVTYEGNTVLFQGMKLIIGEKFPTQR